VRPAVHGDRHDVAFAPEAARAEHAVELVPDSVLEYGKRRRVELRAPRAELVACRQAGRAGGAPELTAFAILDADFPLGSGAVFGNLSWTWQDDRPGGWLPLTPESTTFPESQRMLEGWSLFNLTIGYPSAGDWTAALYAENLTDETYSLGGSTGGNINDPYVQHNWGMGRPRTVGIRTTYRF
jgi:outer membrane receptor protein involved in Fe transport